MSELRMVERSWVKFKLYEEVTFGWAGKEPKWEGIVVGFTRLDNVVHYAIETPDGINGEEEEAVMIIIRTEADVRRRE